MVNESRRPVTVDKISTSLVFQALSDMFSRFNMSSFSCMCASEDLLDCCFHCVVKDCLTCEEEVICSIVGSPQIDVAAKT